MYRKIMTPVDLAHLPHLEKALKTSADLAKHYGISVCYVGITTETPSAIAHNPSEYAAKLEAFAQSQTAEFGHKAEAKAYATHDPTTDMDRTLADAATEVGADLVVMASHEPEVRDLLIPAHGIRLASHVNISVLLVR